MPNYENEIAKAADKALVVLCIGVVCLLLWTLCAMAFGIWIS